MTLFAPAAGSRLNFARSDRYTANTGELNAPSDVWASFAWGSYLALKLRDPTIFSHISSPVLAVYLSSLLEILRARWGRAAPTPPALSLRDDVSVA